MSVVLESVKCVANYAEACVVCIGNESVVFILFSFYSGERRIRVHTLCIPVTSSITEVFAGADQQAITCLLAKMGRLGSMSIGRIDVKFTHISCHNWALLSSLRLKYMLH